MSQGGSQEFLIRSLLEALCLLIKDFIQENPEHYSSPMLEAVEKLEKALCDLHTRFPLAINDKESQIIIQQVLQIDRIVDNIPEGQRPETVISMLLVLVEHLWRKASSKSGKKALVDAINAAVIELYDIMDPLGNKYDLMEKGAAIADLIV